jgi:hypothetical protein
MRNITAFAIIIFAFVASSATNVFGYGFCSPPVEPSCIDSLSLSRDEFTFNSCRDEVESYRRGVKSYIDCMLDEVQTERDEQVRKLNDVIERFNCYAKGDSIC